MKAYLRFDPLKDERLAHYTDGQYRAYDLVLFKAGRQDPRGRFSSEAQVRALLGRHARHLPFLFSEGAILALDDGAVYVAGWDEWQEGDLTVRDRMAALRSRKRNAAVTQPLPDAIRSSVSSSVSVVVGASAPTGARNVTDDPADAYWGLTGRYPSGKVLAWIDDLAGRYGQEPTTRALAQAHMVDAATATLLGRATDLLKAEARALDRKEQADEQARLREKRAVPKELPAWEQEFRAKIAERYAK